MLFIGDAVVVFPAFGLAYLGELFPGKTAPTIDSSHGGSAVAFPDTLARAVAALKGVEIIVPGRVAPSNRGNLLKRLPSLKDLQEYADFTAISWPSSGRPCRRGRARMKPRPL